MIMLNINCINEHEKNLVSNLIKTSFRVELKRFIFIEKNKI